MPRALRDVEDEGGPAELLTLLGQEATAGDIAERLRRAYSPVRTPRHGRGGARLGTASTAYE